MNNITVTKLDLRAPLCYVKRPGLRLFDRDILCGQNTETQPGGEQIFCFELDAVQSLSIEPDREHFFEALLFSGLAREYNDEKEKAETVTLPQGLYLFSQTRETLDREACSAMAIEQQKDGLWERYALRNLLYIRRLFEDGSPVTQLFRPLKNGNC